MHGQPSQRLATVQRLATRDKPRALDNVDVEFYRVRDHCLTTTFRVKSRGHG